MKKFWFTVLVAVAMAGFSGCGNKPKESALSEAFEEATSGSESATNQEQFLIYENEGGSPTAEQSVGEQAVTSETTATVPAEQAAIAVDKPTDQQIQQALKNAGLYDGAIDGKIGPMTKKAIRKFQIQNDLTVDGKVGKKTWIKLAPYLNAAAVSPATSAAEPVQAEAENTY